MGRYRTAHQPHPGDVRLLHLIEFLQRQFLDRPADIDAGVVNQDVEVIITTIAAFVIMIIAKSVHHIALNVMRLFAWAVVVNVRTVRSLPVRIV